MINTSVESKVTRNKFANNMSLNEQERSSQVKQKIFDKLIQENNYQTKTKKQRQLKTKQSKQIKIPDEDIETRIKEVENQKG